MSDLTRYAIGGPDGVVILIADSAVEPIARDGGFVIASDTADVGWHLVDGALTSDTPTPTPAALIQAISDAQNATSAAGVRFVVSPEMPAVAGPDVPAVTILADGGPTTLTYLLALKEWASDPKTPPDETFRWWGNDGIITPITPAQALILAGAVGAWVMNLGNAATAAVGLVEAGTITSLAQVRDLAWPTA